MENFSLTHLSSLVNSKKDILLEDIPRDMYHFSDFGSDVEIFDRGFYIKLPFLSNMAPLS